MTPATPLRGPRFLVSGWQIQEIPHQLPAFFWDVKTSVKLQQSQKLQPVLVFFAAVGKLWKMLVLDWAFSRHALGSLVHLPLHCPQVVRSCKSVWQRLLASQRPGWRPASPGSHPQARPTYPSAPSLILWATTVYTSLASHTKTIQANEPTLQFHCRNSFSESKKHHCHVPESISTTMPNPFAASKKMRAPSIPASNTIAMQNDSLPAKVIAEHFLPIAKTPLPCSKKHLCHPTRYTLQPPRDSEAPVVLPQ